MAFPGITNDFWIDFESLGTNGTAATQANLNASCHGVVTGWNITGANSGVASNGLLTAQTGASDGVTDGSTGTIGMQYSSATGAAGVVEYALPSAKSSLSFGLAYRTTNGINSFVEGPHFVTLFDGGAFNQLMRLSDEKDGGDNTRQIRLSPGSGSGARVAISDNTWYWVTAKWVSGGTDQLNVYNSSLVLVGSASWADTFTSTTAKAILLGAGNGPMESGGATTAFDNFILDTTNANFPLLPSAGAADALFAMSIF